MHKHIYTFSYSTYESDLCKMESRHLFGREEKYKQLFSDIKVEPSHSAFVKRRLDIALYAEEYSDLIEKIEVQKIKAEGFKVEYLVLESDGTRYDERLSKLRDVGYRIEGIPKYQKPDIVYAIAYDEGYWYFGPLTKNSYAWQQHQQKPRSFSNAITINIAKALVNMATEGDNSRNLLDACCGVGTILLEACFAGIPIDGCDINWKVCVQSRENLAYFDYHATVYRSDIINISKQYDAAIIDLPYNLFSCADEATFAHIINATAHISKRLLIVSITDISSLISNAGMVLLDHTRVGKSGKTAFERRIWLCEKGG